MTKIRTNLTQVWVDKVPWARSRLVVLSPYITPCKTVSILIESSACVYTRFNLRDFASGASSLDALEELAETCQLFEIPDLHAKIIMDGSTFATVGSQNLTFNGASKNKEMNLCLDAGKAPRGFQKLRRTVGAWIAEAIPIDSDRIRIMRTRLERAQLAFKNFDTVLAGLQDEVDRATAKMVNDKNKHGTETGDEKNRQQIARVVSKAGTPETVVDASVVESGVKTPFLRFKAQKLTTYIWEGRSEPIESLKRYMCVLPSGGLRWARVATGQITRIGSYLRLGSVLDSFPLLSITITSSRKTIQRGPAGTNVVALIRGQEELICRIPMRFRLNTLKIFEAVPSRSTKEAKAFVTWLSVNRIAFKTMMLQRIGEPNDADRRGKLYGLNAKQVLGAHGTEITLKVIECNGYPLLVLTRHS